MDKKFSAKKYFIFGFKKYVMNDNKILAQNYMPSIREILCDYIEIYKEINNNSGQEKLERARNDLLKALKFFCENSIFFEKGIYKIEIKILTDQIEHLSDKGDQNKILKYTKIYKICKSLVKKFNKDNIYAHLINIAMQSDKYIEIDKVIEALISELLYDGYSLKYLDVWYNENVGRQEINDKNIDNIIGEFQKLKKGKDRYIYYLSVFDKNKKIKEEQLIDYNIKLVKEEYGKLVLINKENDKNVKNYIQHTKEDDIFRIEMNAMDIYKGLEVIVNAFDSYFQMINYLLANDKIILKDKCIVKLTEGNYTKLRIQSYDNKILFSNIENRERQDIEDFIMHRDSAYNTLIKSDEIANIQRAINIVKGQKDQLKENRLINLWSVLEYSLTFHEGVSIISKVKEVVPKIICLYAIKDKLNVFWSRLFCYKGNEIDIVEEFIKECKRVDDDYYYDLNNLVQFILKKGKSLLDEFEFNDVLKRNIGEIGKLLTDVKYRKKYIKNKHDEVYYDLVRIYRARNVLIHSGKRTMANMDYKSLRLYNYNNSLLGVIVYYKNKNPYLTIGEILNSIDYTYNEYLNILENEKSSTIDICKPQYLFIG
ncbi:hypothetical protein [Crassaminicella profunda]|uniref:hypothetical protein n=1 Tax=Crassaminicella profunda TaxID=1286698 RepID=UPI001CA624D8|nr:hypothetical protein [Crassaminicella profunda]QZY54089.1 hypothetical protein K7H06_13665 [Crassaminicella profunda]